MYYGIHEFSKKLNKTPKTEKQELVEDLVQIITLFSLSCKVNVQIR